MRKWIRSIQRFFGERLSESNDAAGAGRQDPGELMTRQMADFIYYNHVIKPALVGLTGPWISGGIEFNWPQHHRPSTFDQVEYTYAENEDGSATVWMGEIENMFRTEESLGVTLYPDKAYIELSVKLYNRAKMPQTFLWWANPAVAVNDDTISVFPEDVTAVYDHGKRDVISFPMRRELIISINTTM